MRSAENFSTEQLQRTLRALAKIVSGRDGEAYIPIFERIEDELAARNHARDARARARALLQETTNERRT